MAMQEKRSPRECFSADRDALFHAFRCHASLKFSDFASCWRDHKFGFVLYGRRVKELRVWLSDAYAVALTDVRADQPLERRVFGLFLLYALYFRQPSKPMPIRVSLIAFEPLLELRQLAQQQKLLDVLFVWHKLVSSTAFQVVFSDKIYGPTTAKASVKATTDASISRAADLLSTLDPELALVSDLNSKYEGLKQKLAKSNPAVEDLLSQEADVFSEFRSRLNTEIYRSQVQADPLDKDAQKEDSIGEKRRRLKNRVMRKDP